MSIRTRFAPSPTGMMHVGNARTALFNWLLARHHGGALILRIEDTDRERSTKENIQVILDALNWLGLGWDEGPYFQSQRFELYGQTIDRLLAEGKAYRCRCTAEDLAAKREQAQKEKNTYLYDRTCRDKNYGPEEPHVIRFKMPVEGVTVVEDQIMGRVEVNHAELDDWIIARTDGTPTYNFCVVVDDSDMRVTHVVRGADHLINTHKQVPLYQALGFTLPKFAHMPLTLGQDRSKLSKRHGATNILDYRQMGYLPQAMRNFLVRLGWAHGDQELFTDSELIAAFDLSGVSSSNAVFDPDKLNWINATKMRELPVEELAELAKPFLEKRGFAAETDPRLPEICHHLAERTKTLDEMAELARMFYRAPEEYDAKAVKKWWKGQAKVVLAEVLTWLENKDSLAQGDVIPFLEHLTEKLETKMGKVAQPIRIALVGASASPPIDATVFLVGREEAMARIKKAMVELPDLETSA